MPKYLEKLKQLAAPIGRGLAQEIAPGIAGGIIVVMFHQWNVDVDRIVEDVVRDRSLWAEMGPDERRQLAVFARQLGNLDFMTPKLIIDSIKGDFPAVASLFLNWPEAAEWLVRQINELKTRVGEE